MAKASSRVNGKHGENMWVTDDELCFRTGGKVRKMPRAELVSLSVENTEDARNAVANSDLVPFGAWTEEMPSVDGKSSFLVAKSETECWVLEVAKSQLPNVKSFVGGILPKQKDEGDGKVIPGRAIDTPRGAIFTVASIACVFIAYALVYNFQLPIPGIIVAIAGIVMFLNIK